MRRAWGAWELAWGVMALLENSVAESISAALAQQKWRKGYLLCPPHAAL